MCYFKLLKSLPALVFDRKRKQKAEEGGAAASVRKEWDKRHGGERQKHVSSACGAFPGPGKGLVTACEALGSAGRRATVAPTGQPDELDQTGRESTGFGTPSAADTAAGVLACSLLTWNDRCVHKCEPPRTNPEAPTP